MHSMYSRVPPSLCSYHQQCLVRSAIQFATSMAYDEHQLQLFAASLLSSTLANAPSATQNLHIAAPRTPLQRKIHHDFTAWSLMSRPTNMNNQQQRQSHWGYMYTDHEHTLAATVGAATSYQRSTACSKPYELANPPSLAPLYTNIALGPLHSGKHAHAHASQS